MRLFYREPNGDFLAVDHETASYYCRIGKPDIREGRAAGIAGSPSSVCTTGISLKYLRGRFAESGGPCVRVAKRNVPREWLRYIEPNTI